MIDLLHINTLILREKEKEEGKRKRRKKGG